MLPRLPEDADLVLFDFGINDFQQSEKLNHPERHALERMMRRVLSLPRCVWRVGGREGIGWWEAAE